MRQKQNRMRRPFILAVLVTALVLLPASAFCDATQSAIIATAAADYSSGTHCVADVDPIGGPRAIQTDLLPTGSDIMVAAYENSFYRLERYQADNVIKFNLAAPDTPVYQYSVLGDGETGSANPHAMLFVSAEKAYVLRYGQTTAWIVNPAATTEAEFKIGELDLSAYADSDGTPEMESGVIVDGVLYIAMQRLDRDNGFAPTNTSYVALFDTATDTEIDTETENSDGVKGIALPIFNTGAVQYLAANDTIYVQGVGDYGSSFSGHDPAYTGGIATINPTTYETDLLVDDGDDAAHPYGNFSGMAIVSADKGYFVGYAGWGDNTVYGFSPTTGEVSGAVSDELSGLTIAGMQSGTYADTNGMLWVCNQTDAEVVLLDTADDTIDEKISTNLNPLMVVFASADDGTDGEKGNNDDDDDSSCFIESILGGLFD